MAGVKAVPCARFPIQCQEGENCVAGERKGDALPAGTGHPFSLPRCS